MDNNQMPGMPGMNGMSGMPMNGGMPGGQQMPNGQIMSGGMGGSMQAAPGVQSIQPAGPQYPGQQPMQQMGPNGMPMVQQVQAPVVPKKDISGLIKTIVIIFLSLLAVTFIGLFIWMMMEKNEAQSNLDEKIDIATAEARHDQAEKDEAEFTEREKYPYKTFAGPADYGELTFEYPKTWSVYVAEAANTGGDFNAYFNPMQVDAVGKDTINALRVTILTKSFDDVTADYQKSMDKKNSNLTMESVTIGKNNNIVANRYTGTIPNTELNGFIVIFKIRDKSVILQTDSVLFQADYDKLLGTVTFNE